VFILSTLMSSSPMITVSISSNSGVLHHYWLITMVLQYRVLVVDFSCIITIFHFFFWISISIVLIYLFSSPPLLIDNYGSVILIPAYLSLCSLFSLFLYENFCKVYMIYVHICSVLISSMLASTTLPASFLAYYLL
jgi:hypothetical protein